MLSVEQAEIIKNTDKNDAKTLPVIVLKDAPIRSIRCVRVPDDTSLSRSNFVGIKFGARICI